MMRTTTTTPSQLQPANLMATTGIAQAASRNPRLSPRQLLHQPLRLQLVERVRALQVRQLQQLLQLVRRPRLDRERLHLLVLLVLGCCRYLGLRTERMLLTACRISLDSLPFHIRANLLDALRRLRQPLSTIIIWTDALCIDQNSAVEKSVQVRGVPDRRIRRNRPDPRLRTVSVKYT
jgi:hypothetical protein